MGQGEICPRECQCWKSIYDADSKVIISTALAGLGLIANRALEREEIIAAFGESIVLRGRAADEAHELIINYNTMCTVGRGFQYSIRRKLASETTHTIVMPSADRLLALAQRGISPDLRRSLNQGTGTRGWAHLANHTCCARHCNARLEVLSVANTDIGEYDSQDTEVGAVLRANRSIPIHDTILTCYRDSEGEGPHDQLLRERQTLARILDCQCCECTGKCGSKQSGGAQITPVPVKREIMLFIGKPKERSKMISNQVPVKAARDDRKRKTCTPLTVPRRYATTPRLVEQPPEDVPLARHTPPGSFSLRDGQSTTFLFGHFPGDS